MKSRSALYPFPGWGWQKPAPKRSLHALGRAHQADGWILNLVELGHWLNFVAGFALCWLLFRHADVLTTRFGAEWRSFALTVSPLIALIGGAAPVLMHDYEGWQVAPCRSPLPAANVRPDDRNNDLLRQSAYRLLHIWLTLSFLSIGLAVFGAPPPLLGLAVVCVAVAFLGPRTPVMEISIRGETLFPLPVALLVVFVIQATVAMVALVVLLADPLRAIGLPPLLGLLPTLSFLTAAFLEGALAESAFNQWWHLMAVVVFTIGLLAEMALFSLLW